MTSIALKTGGRAQWSASFLITLKTGDVIEVNHLCRQPAGSLHAVNPAAQTGQNPSAAPWLKNVFSTNIAHRHLEKGQLAMAGARLKGYFAQKARERQEASQFGGGKFSTTAAASDQGKARDQAAEKVGVSGKSPSANPPKNGGQSPQKVEEIPPKTGPFAIRLPSHLPSNCHTRRPT